MTNFPPTPALKRFATRLRKTRTKGKVSQRQLAEMVDTVDHFQRKVKITAAYVSRLESAERFPSVEVVHAIADALGVDREWLLTGRKNSGSPE